MIDRKKEGGGAKWGMLSLTCEEHLCSLRQNSDCQSHSESLITPVWCSFGFPDMFLSSFSVPGGGPKGEQNISNSLETWPPCPLDFYNFPNLTNDHRS